MHESSDGRGGRRDNDASRYRRAIGDSRDKKQKKKSACRSISSSKVTCSQRTARNPDFYFTLAYPCTRDLSILGTHRCSLRVRVRMRNSYRRRAPSYGISCCRGETTRRRRSRARVLQFKIATARRYRLMQSLMLLHVAAINATTTSRSTRRYCRFMRVLRTRTLQTVCRVIADGVRGKKYRR